MYQVQRCEKSNLRINEKVGAPGGARTPDLQIRSLPLYPTELQARVKSRGLSQTISEALLPTCIKLLRHSWSAYNQGYILHVTYCHRKVPRWILRILWSNGQGRSSICVPCYP
jgi:hypothetical protein